MQKKARLGYPLTNIIFEDTSRALLSQNRQLVFEATLSDPKQVAALLSGFYSYEEPDLVAFQHAVTEFGQALPDLAAGLIETIRVERKQSPTFIKAFGEFTTLCQSAINPQITPEAMEEMLAQHLLTERLFRTIFDNPDFASRNAIAHEIEVVISALTSRSFNRTEFLRKLDRFYLPIEQEAKRLDDWSLKPDHPSFFN